MVVSINQGTTMAKCHNDPRYADLQKGTHDFWKPAMISGYTGLAALLEGGFPRICGGFMFMWGFRDFLMMVETQGFSADKQTCENGEYLLHCYCPSCIAIVNSISEGDSYSPARLLLCCSKCYRSDFKVFAISVLELGL